MLLYFFIWTGLELLSDSSLYISTIVLSFLNSLLLIDRWFRCSIPFEIRLSSILFYLLALKQEFSFSNGLPISRSSWHKSVSMSISSGWERQFRSKFTLIDDSLAIKSFWDSIVVSVRSGVSYTCAKWFNFWLRSVIWVLSWCILFKDPR